MALLKARHNACLERKIRMAEYAYDIYLFRIILQAWQCFDFNRYKLFEFDFICEKAGTSLTKA